MSEFFLKKVDVLPVLQAELLDDAGVIDLSNVTGVYFNYRPKYASTGTIKRTGFVASAVSGIVEYDWTTGDTTTPGVYYAEWIIYFQSNKQMSFPNDDYITFEIVNTL